MIAHDAATGFFSFFLSDVRVRPNLDRKSKEKARERAEVTPESPRMLRGLAAPSRSSPETVARSRRRTWIAKMLRARKCCRRFCQVASREKQMLEMVPKNTTTVKTTPTSTTVRSPLERVPRTAYERAHARIPVAFRNAGVARGRPFVASPANLVYGSCLMIVPPAKRKRPRRPRRPASRRLRVCE